nr:hypothetical protein PCFP23_340 [Curtobacterium flaccumfaciens pv. poinsettiae]
MAMRTAGAHRAERADNGVPVSRIDDADAPRVVAAVVATNEDVTAGADHPVSGPALRGVENRTGIAGCERLDDAGKVDHPIGAVGGGERSAGPFPPVERECVHVANFGGGVREPERYVGDTAEHVRRVVEAVPVVVAGEHCAHR